MSKPPQGLTLEQQFELKKMKSAVAVMNEEQAKDMLLQLMEVSMTRETMYRHFLKEAWGLSQ